jgi:hypothetical protein
VFHDPTELVSVVKQVGKLTGATIPALFDPTVLATVVKEVGELTGGVPIP